MKMLFKDHSNHLPLCSCAHTNSSYHDTWITHDMVPFMHLGKESNVDEDAL